MLVSGDLQQRSQSEYVRVAGVTTFDQSTDSYFLAAGSALHQQAIPTHRFAVNAGSEDVMGAILRSMPTTLGILHIDSATQRPADDFAIVKGSLTHLMPRLVDGGFCKHLLLL